MTRRDAIAKHEIYWSEVGSDEKHLFETLEGYLGPEATRLYDIEESGLPSGKSIYFTIKAYDENGNYTTMELPTNVAVSYTQLARLRCQTCRTPAPAQSPAR